jgi:hypothetical protein
MVPEEAVPGSEQAATTGPAVIGHVSAGQPPSAYAIFQTGDIANCSLLPPLPGPGLFTAPSQVFTLAEPANTECQDARTLRRKSLDKKQLELAGLETATLGFRFFLLSMTTSLLSTPEHIRASLVHILGDHSKTAAKKIERQGVPCDNSKPFILTEQAASQNS